MTQPATGVVIVYGCFCSDAGDQLDQLPEVCPGHGRPRLSSAVNRRPGGVATGHDCPSDYRCPGGPA